MKLNVVEIFCEILSGLILGLIFLPLLGLFNVSTINESWTFINSNLTTGNVTLIIITSYLIGLIVDSVGLSIGEWFLDKKLATEAEPTSDECKTFYNNVEAHILTYRETQWAYLSLYRNLYILAFPHLIIWSIYFISTKNWAGLITTGISLIILIVTLHKSIKILIDHYYKITKYIVKNTP